MAELLHDDSLAFATDNKYPESEHAPSSRPSASTEPQHSPSVMCLAAGLGCSTPSDRSPFNLSGSSGGSEEASRRPHGSHSIPFARAGSDQQGGIMGAFGFVFISLPVIAIVCFTCFAACRAQRQQVFKVLSHVFLAAGLLCVLTPIGLVAAVWITV
ncbi:hypothetical protein AB0C77_25400 [Streptomyces sp. NPDC048629]|uniref:hypothetical protein n=1 Tax=Streptomyces sp. NPDC048629 TaxID=3154824 RepID=UPI00343BED8C